LWSAAKGHVLAVFRVFLDLEPWKRQFWTHEQAFVKAGLRRKFDADFESEIIYAMMSLSVPSLLPALSNESALLENTKKTRPLLDAQWST